MSRPSRTSALLALLLLCTASLAAGRKLRIHHGTPADAAASKQLAFIVAFYHTPANAEEAASMTPFCTGTLISSNVVLSAAHCFYDDGEFNDDVSARIEGEWDRLIKVSEIVIPSGYAHASQVEDDAVPYDVAVVQLSEDATVAPASVVSATFEPATGAELLIAGYGDTDQTVGGDRGGPSTTNVMHYATVQYMAHTCPGLVEGTVCAGGSANTCQGDSGGPLLAQDTAGLWQVLGVTSYGRKCGRSAAEGKVEWGAYTDVRAYIDDLDSMIATLLSPEIELQQQAKCDP